MTRPHPAIVMLAACVVCVLSACAGPGRDQKLARDVERGEYGLARERVTAQLITEKKYRVKRLNQFIALCNADGVPRLAEAASTEAYEILRAQGANRAGAESIGGGDLWKGEPFEQAMTFANVAVQRAMCGEWDNARAAAGESLFRLKDFRDSQERKSDRVLDKDDLTERAGRHTKDGDDWLDHGYVDTQTDFALGYMLAGVANLALGRTDEASDQFRQAAALRPELADAGQRLLRGEANTILLVEYGEGPQKVASGKYRSIGAFRPMTRSDPRPLRIQVSDPGDLAWDAISTHAGESPTAAPVLCDLNEMSRDHRWQSLDDVRTVRASIGNALLVGGTAATAVGVGVGRGHGGNAAAIAGLGAILAGLALRESARADETYDEGLPQRVYFAAVMVREPRSSLSLGFPGGEHVVLPEIDPPKGWSADPAKAEPGTGNLGNDRLQLRLFRLPTAAGGSRGRDEWSRGPSPLRYAAGAAPPAGPQVAGDGLPYILGGTCVRRPTPEVLAYYQSQGQLASMTLNELENLYRAEGVSLDGSGEAGAAARGDAPAVMHILEGGKSIQVPLAGTAGYLRLLCREHPAYRPRSKELAEAIESLRRK